MLMLILLWLYCGKFQGQVDIVSRLKLLDPLLTWCEILESTQFKGLDLDHASSYRNLLPLQRDAPLVQIVLHFRVFDLAPRSRLLP